MAISDLARRQPAAVRVAIAYRLERMWAKFPTELQRPEKEYGPIRRPSMTKHRDFDLAALIPWIGEPPEAFRWATLDLWPLARVATHALSTCRVWCQVPCRALLCADVRMGGPLQRVAFSVMSATNGPEFSADAKLGIHHFRQGRIGPLKRHMASCFRPSARPGRNALQLERKRLGTK